jgi:hypothetical protein
MTKKMTDFNFGTYLKRVASQQPNVVTCSLVQQKCAMFWIHYYYKHKWIVGRLSVWLDSSHSNVLPLTYYPRIPAYGPLGNAGLVPEHEPVQQCIKYTHSSKPSLTTSKCWMVRSLKLDLLWTITKVCEETWTSFSIPRICKHYQDNRGAHRPYSRELDLMNLLLIGSMDNNKQRSGLEGMGGLLGGDYF